MATSLPSFIGRLGGLLATVLFLNLSPVAAQAPTWQWGLQSTNPAGADNSEAGSVAVAADAAGRAYVAGNYRNHTGSTATATRAFAGAGVVGPGLGGFVAQATAAGQWAWVTAAVPLGMAPNGAALTEVSGLTASSAGDVYVTGTAYGSSVQVGSVSASLGASGSGMFVAKLSAAGVCQWVRAVEGSFNGASLAGDPSTGGVALAGSYSGTAVLGGFALPASTASTGRSVYVARLSATGIWQAATAVGGTASVPQTVFVAVGPSGQVAVVGSQRAGSLTFGTRFLLVPTAVDAAYFVAQLSPTNQWQWAVGGSGSTASGGFGAAYTGFGALWVSGRGTNGTQVGSDLLTTPMGAGPSSFAGFIGQLSATGQWATVGQLSLTTAGTAAFGPLAVDAANNAVLLGGMTGFGGAVQGRLGALTLTAPANGALFFIAGYSSTGQWRYAATVPQPALPNGFNANAIALASPSELYLTGAFRGGLTFGSSVLNATYNSTSSSPGYGEAVLGKLINANLTPARAGAAAGTLSVFPAPAHGAATLRLPAAVPAETSFALLDALGRSVRRFAVPAHASEASLDLRGLPAGLYVVRGSGTSARLVVE